MRYELFIALRYLFARRGHAFISVISWISVAGVALGVASLIVVMGVMNGFTTDLRDKIIGVTAHAIIFKLNGPAMEDPAVLEKIAAVPGVAAATPFTYSELMISSSSGVKGIVLRGVDPKTGPLVLGALNKVTEGSVAALNEPGGLPGIIVGKDLARKLNLYVGSRVNLLAPAGQQSSAGFTPRIKPFRVVGIFSIGLFEYDSSLAFVSLPTARDIMGLPAGQITGIELAVTDVYKAREIADRAVAAIGPYYTQTWMDMNANLFAALKLEKSAMAVILALVVLVGSFSIITALVMLVMEKVRDIAILMSMGATKAGIRNIFIFQGLVIGVMGTAIGLALGLGASFLLKRYHFIDLPKGVYSLDYLPVLLHWPDIALTVAVAITLCFFATLYPAGKAAGLEPVAALRHE